jgi:hypothetical protein
VELPDLFASQDEFSDEKCQFLFCIKKVPLNRGNFDQFGIFRVTCTPVFSDVKSGSIWLAISWKRIKSS